MKKLLLILIFAIGLSLQAKEKIKVACIGNSVTYGYLLPDREKSAYPSQLQVLLGDKYQVKNYGKSGSTLLSKGHRPYIDQVEYKEALEYAADIVIIHLGLNDTDPRNWSNYRDDFFRDYLKLIDSFKERNPNAQIWISRMTPITHKHPRFISGTRDWHKEIQKTIESIASYTNVGLIDLEESLYNRPDLFPDALHPITEGAGIIAQKVYSAITGDYGGLQMPIVYSDNMVLQRNIPLKIQGVANAGEEIQINIVDQTVRTRACSNGKWVVTLAPIKEGGPYNLVIFTSTKTITYRNILIGEVWLCSGQSNMEFLLSNDADFEMNKDLIDNKNIRLFNMQPRFETNAQEWDASALDSLNQLQYFNNRGWQECTTKSASNFSAVAYYFGKMLSDSLNIPIGLICNAVGGSPLESWIERSILESDFPEILDDWENNDLIQDWVRERATLNIKKTENPEQRHPYEPCYLFESGIIPLKEFPIKGVIWYQGESNAHNVEAFEKLFPLFVESWRAYWKSSKLPIYYVQLSSLNRPSWTWFRDSQRQMMDKLPCTYMAVSSDRGDSLDVHPRNKKDIGRRLAFWALNKSYENENIVPSGPLYKSVEFEEGIGYITFDYSEGMHTSDGGDIRGFEIAEVEGLYYPAHAIIVNQKAKVWSEKVKHPRFVRYGWQPFTRANVINKAKLPMSTFKSSNKNREFTQ